MSSLLPAHARLLTGEGVTIEDAAVAQLARVAAEPGCCRAVGMPDLHPGRGIPVGAVFAFEGRVRPGLIGGDAGCGVRLTVVGKAKHRGDALLRRIEAATEGPALPDANPAELLAAVWAEGPRGLADVAGVPESLAALAALEPADDDPPSGRCPAGDFGAQLGTAGGGNHFLELGEVDVVADAPTARSLGLARGTLVVIAHSGSRGLGGALAAQAPAMIDDPAAIAAWRADLAGACRYARANRLVLTWRLLEALGAARPDRLGGQFELVHNTVERQGDWWIHRKGAAPAAAGQPTVVLGSRGAPSFVMLGTGDDGCLASVAHGAGRRFDRGEAGARFAARHTRASLRRTALGGHVICDDAGLLFEEHPEAYKPIEPVIAALEAAGAGVTVARIVPRVTIKR